MSENLLNYEARADLLDEIKQLTFRISYISLWIGLAATMLWTVVDHLLLPRLWLHFLSIRLVIVAIAILMLVLVRLKPYRKQINTVFMLIILMLNFELEYMISLVDGHTLTYVMPIGVTMLTLALAINWHPFRFYLATSLTALGALWFWSRVPLIQLSTEIVVASLFYLGTMLILGILSVNLRYYSAKKAFELRIRLEEQNRYAQMLLNTIPSGVYTTDQERLVTTWNKRASEITGYLPEDVLGQPCRIFHCDPCVFNCPSILATEQLPARDVICQIQTRAGHSRMISKNVVELLSPRGEKIGRLECFDDVTNRLKAEMELEEAKQAAEEANAVKGQFIANISHEIRTP